jgi:hypothetical protein
MSTRDAGQVRGNPNTEGTLRSDLQFQQATANKVATNRAALDVASLGFAQLVASDTAETGSTTSVLTVTGHSALVGDVLIFTSGSLNRQMFTVYAVAANTITLGQTSSVAASNGDGFDILRFALPRVDSAGGVRIGTVSGTVTADTELPAAAALADNTGNPTVPAVGSFGMLWDGSTWDRSPGTSADGTLVNLGANNDVTVTGAAAHDAAVSGNPVLMGQDARSALPTAVTAGNAVRLIADLFGRQIINFYAPIQTQSHHTATCNATTSPVTIRGAQGSGIRNTIVQLILTNRHATTSTVVSISDGTTSKVLHAPANSMQVINNPIPWRFADNTAVTATTTTSVDRVVVDCLMVNSTI